jgi:hypothetical protein
MTHANSALPWIVFERDRAVLEARFTRLEVLRVNPIMPVRYLLSGGLSMRAVVPSWSFALWRVFDDRLVRAAPGTAMFAHIVVRRHGT